MDYSSAAKGTDSFLRHVLWHQREVWVGPQQQKSAIFLPSPQGLGSREEPVTSRGVRPPGSILEKDESIFKRPE